MKVASFEFQQIAKQEMGFVTEPKHCRDCVFYESVEDPALDRSWIPCCKMFEAGVACFVKQMGAKPYETNIGVAIKNDAVVSIAAKAHPHLQGFTRITDSDGTYLRKNWRLKDKKGGNILEWPEDLRVREVPR